MRTLFTHVAPVALVALVAFAASADAQPAITVAPASIELGSVAQAKLDTVVVITNTGSEPLMVQKLLTSCGCTTTKFEARTIAPGETARVPVTVDARSKKGDFRTSISVLSNDPRTPSVTVPIHGAAMQASAATPGSDSN